MLYAETSPVSAYTKESRLRGNSSFTGTEAYKTS